MRAIRRRCCCLDLRVHPFFLSRLLCVPVVVCVLQDVRRLCEAPLHKPQREIGGNARKTRNACTERRHDKRGERQRVGIGIATPRGSLATTTIRLHSNYLHMLPGNVPACLVYMCVCVCACCVLCACVRRVSFLALLRPGKRAAFIAFLSAGMGLSIHYIPTGARPIFIVNPYGIFCLPR